ncbi:MmcQ/YjbR family DNA-binding protein [Streptosporangiaceae bacterium NEAU-GS5]|nr:MmcQ/YjbR family DNA-binding protein [Streptosporangiaceae bacterium NEAU-GS5]
MNEDEFTRHALSLPEVEQTTAYGPWGFALKVRGKSFAFIAMDGDVAHVKATREEQAAWAAEDPAAFEPSYSAGRFGWVLVRLPRADSGDVRELLTEAWRLTAPKRLLPKLSDADL